MRKVPEPGQNVLLIDDDRHLTNDLTRYFNTCGYAASSVHPRAALTGVRDGSLAAPLAIVMDLVFRDVDGLLLVDRLRHRFNCSILIQTATRRTRDAEVALYLGADSFVRKPCEPEEVFERVRALIRRRSSASAGETRSTAQPVTIGPLTLDAHRGRAMLGSAPLRLTPTEFRLLLSMASTPGEIVSHDGLARRVWNYPSASAAPSISVHVQNLRAKLAKHGSGAPAINAVRGLGYILVPR